MDSAKAWKVFFSAKRCAPPLGKAMSSPASLNKNRTLASKKEIRHFYAVSFSEHCCHKDQISRCYLCLFLFVWGVRVRFRCCCDCCCCFCCCCCWCYRRHHQHYLHQHWRFLILAAFICCKQLKRIVVLFQSNIKSQTHRAPQISENCWNHACFNDAASIFVITLQQMRKTNYMIASRW